MEYKAMKSPGLTGQSPGEAGFLSIRKEKKVHNLSSSLNHCFKAVQHKIKDTASKTHEGTVIPCPSL